MDKIPPPHFSTNGLAASTLTKRPCFLIRQIEWGEARRIATAIENSGTFTFATAEHRCDSPGAMNSVEETLIEAANRYPHLIFPNEKREDEAEKPDAVEADNRSGNQEIQDHTNISRANLMGQMKA